VRVKYVNNTAILIPSALQKAKEKKASGRFFPVYLHKHTYTYTSVYVSMCVVYNEERKVCV